MFLTIKKWTIVYVLSLVAIFFSFAAVFSGGDAVQTGGAVSVEAPQLTLVLDAGHGGEDGGAVVADGTEEAEINLSIALLMEEYAGLLGVETVMTRREDLSLHDQSAVTLREKKVSDLKNRVDLCNSTPGAVLVSIHQNTLPGAPSVHGAQVFYNGISGSQELAVAIQSALTGTVNTGNAKSPKEIGDSVYLMKHVTCPAVIVECGFLSNPGETGLLQQEDYQKKLAAVILSAALEHFAP